MKITVAGAGYVGLSIALLLAQHNEVKIIDIVPDKVNKINKHISPIQDEFIQNFMNNNKLNLVATLDEEAAYQDADYVIIATPTLYNDEKNSFDTSKVEKVIEDVLEYNPKATMVIKSTIPVGYTKRIRDKYNTNNILFSPEFLRESMALYDSLNPSRIIVGTNNENKEKANNFAFLLKEGANKTDIPVLLMNDTEAEAVKLFANTYLALRVSYFNELDTYAQINGLNTKDIIEGVCLDPRVGNLYNNPSFGYGGVCFTQDVKQMKANFEDIPENVISAALNSNKTRAEFIANDVLRKVRYNNNNKDNIVIGIYNKNSKRNTDGFFNSPILEIIKNLANKNVKVIIYEPLLDKEEYLGCKVIKDINEFINDSSIIVTNRIDECLEQVKNKIYTRDIL